MVIIMIGFCFTLYISHHSASNVGSQRGVPISTSFHSTAISRIWRYATAKLVIFIKWMENSFFFPFFTQPSPRLKARFCEVECWGHKQICRVPWFDCLRWSMVIIIIGFCFAYCFTLYIPHHSASNVGSQRGVPISISFHSTAISRIWRYATAKLVIFIKWMENTF